MIAAEAAENHGLCSLEGRLREAEGAVIDNAPRGMVRAWQATFLGARGRDSWESMIAVGDLARAIGDKLGLPLAFALKARQCYLLALDRAQRMRSSAGAAAAQARLDAISGTLANPRASVGQADSQ